MNLVESVVFNGLLLVAAGGVIYYFVSANLPNIIGAQTNGSSIIDSNGENIQLILFTRESDNKPQYLKPEDGPLFSRSNFNNSNPTKFIIHGFLTSVDGEMFHSIKNAYLQTGDYNVIGVDWHKIANVEYFTAARNTQMVADYLASFINWAHEGKLIDMKQVHIIGHSLGAHISGLLADRLKTRTKLSRITGLDPAGPFFNDAPEFYRLDPTDADIVDVIHTNMRLLSTSHPDGHVDFFPNGGREQPGCPESTSNVVENISCSHGRSYLLFAESVLNKKAFRAMKCETVQDALNSRCFEESDVYMGQPGTYKYGLYYFKTRASSPFTMEQK